MNIKRGSNIRKRVIVYTRVSTDEQAESGYSLETQLEGCRQWVRRNPQYEIVAEISDDFTGKVMDRPGLNQVTEMIELGEADALICYVADRLSRNLVHRGILRDELLSSGVEFITVARGVFDDSPSGRFTDNIEGAVAEYELDLIRERTMRGRQRKAERGIYLGMGVPMYGYHKEGRGRETQLVVDDIEAPIAKYICEMYIFGEDDGPLGTSEIARRLTEMRAPSKGDRRNKSKVRGKYKWSHDMVLSVLKNAEAYSGRYYAYKTKKVDGKVTQRPRDEWIPLDIPPIISVELAKAIQKKIGRSFKRSGASRAAYDWLMAGRINCECGYSARNVVSKGYTPNRQYHEDGKRVLSSKPRRFYYKCIGRTQATAKMCDMPFFNAEVVDEVVWQFLTELVSDPQKLHNSVMNAKAESKERNRTLYSRVENIDRRISKVEEQIDRLLDLYSDNRIPRDMLDEKIAELGEGKKALETEQAKLLGQIERTIPEEQLESILRLAKAMRRKMADASIDVKRQVIEALDVTAILVRQEDSLTLQVDTLLGGEELSGNFNAKYA